MYAREALGDLILNNLAKITLPKLFANELGNVFVPNGTHKMITELNFRILELFSVIPVL